MENETLTEAEQTERGARLAEVLRLKKKRENGRYDIEGGDKTDLGLYLTIKRILEHGDF